MTEIKRLAIVNRGECAMRALTAVGGAATQRFARQTLAAVRNAQSAVHETLELERRLVLHGLPLHARRQRHRHAARVLDAAGDDDFVAERDHRGVRREQPPRERVIGDHARIARGDQIVEA